MSGSPSCRAGATLIATMKANGAYTALVSGGFTPFTSRVAQHLGFDEHQANELIIEDGSSPARWADPILGQQAKLEALRRICAPASASPPRMPLPWATAPTTCHAAAAGLGVALHAKPKVQEAATLRINHGDLTALLYLQGYDEDPSSASDWPLG